MDEDRQRVQDVGWLGANAEVGVGFAERNGSILVDYECGWKRQAPACFGRILVRAAGVDEGDVDQDPLIIAAVCDGDAVGDAEALCDGGSGVGEDRSEEHTSE